MKKMTEAEKNMHYQAGFNDALMLIIEAYAQDSWEKALACFDFSLRDIEKSKITQKNLEEMKIIFE